MKKNKKLLKTVATSCLACLCTCAMVTGIIAATTHNVNVNTSISFTATGVSGTFNGYTQTSGTKANYYYTSGDNHAFAFNNSNTFENDWAIGGASGIQLTTDSNGASVATDIVMEFTSSGSNGMAVGITGLSCLCGVSNLTATYTITGAGTGYSVTTATTLVPQLYFEVGTGTTVFTISLKATNPETDISSITVSNVAVNIAKPADFTTVSFSGGDNSTGSMTSITAFPNTKIKFENAFSKANYNFNGWKVGETAVTLDANNLYTVPSSNATLTAQWEYDITFTKYTSDPATSGDCANFKDYYYTDLGTYNSNSVRWLVLGAMKTNAESNEFDGELDSDAYISFVGTTEGTDWNYSNGKFYAGSTQTTQYNQLLMLSETVLLTRAFNVEDTLLTAIFGSTIPSYIANTYIKTTHYYMGSSIATLGSYSEKLFLLGNDYYYNSTNYSGEVESFGILSAFGLTTSTYNSSTYGRMATTGADSYFWLRSGYYDSISSAYTISSDGSVSYDDIFEENGVRPAFVLDLS